MSCSNCGSQTPCSCSQQVQRNCSCGNSACGGGCGCNSPLPATPLPFYACAPACPENHKQTIVRQQFYYDIAAQNTWNVPECGGTAVLSVPGLVSINIGTYIRNKVYGYFEVVAFDASSQQITVENHCNAGNAATGTTVPACTTFGLDGPPCECVDSSQVCVAIDFTAPANGACVDITLTSTTGLTASDTVEIGSGFYFLQAIKPNDVVTICNHGQGITPGTPVIARDVNGNYQYCLSIISQNSCDRAAESPVRLQGCGADGVTVPMDCQTLGWVATNISGNDGEFACRPIGVLACTTLTAPLVLTSGTASYTNVAVADSSVFQPDDVIEFAGFITFASVSSIPDGTHIDIVFDPAPGANVTYPTGLTICVEDCCRRLDSVIDGMPFGSAEGAASDTSVPTVYSGNVSYTTAPVMQAIVNPSATRNMKVLIHMHVLVDGTYASEDDTPGYGTFAGILSYTLNGGGPTDIVVQNTVPLPEAPGDPSDNHDHDFEVDWTTMQTIAPGATLTVALMGKVQWYNNPVGNLTTEYTADTIDTQIDWIGIPG